MPADERVHSASTLEEVTEAERAREERTVGGAAAVLVVSAVVLLANALLSLLGMLLFRAGRPGEGEVETVVAYTTGTLGDNVVMLPALAALKRRFPAARLVSVVNCDGYGSRFAEEILGRSAFIDELHALPEHPVRRRGLRFVVDAPGVERGRCDLFVNLSPFGNRGWFGAVVREMVFARWLGAAHAVGFEMASFGRTKGWFNGVQHRFMKNEPRRGATVLGRIGVAPAAGEDLLPSDGESRRALRGMLAGAAKEGAPLFVLNPGAKFAVKRWPAESFGAAAKSLAERYGASVVLTGTAEERELAERVRLASGVEALNLAGRTTVGELVELLRLADGCLTNDTGTMHLAAQTGTPTVALFGTRMSPAHWFPAGGKVAVLFSFADCSYSFSDEGGAKECLTKIAVDDVLAAFAKVHGK